MNTQRLACASCGAPLQVAEDADQVTCGYCGAALTVQRSEGQMALRAAGQVSKAIQDTSVQTQSTIREGTYVTQGELKRLQLGQDLATAQGQLSSVQAELRALQREKRTRIIDKQIKELQAQETGLRTQIQQIQQVLNPSSGASSSQKTKREVDPRASRGCVFGCLSFIIVGVLLSFIAIPLDRAIFGIAAGGGESGPIMGFTSMIALVIGVLTYFYITMPNAAMWKPIKKRLQKQNDTQK